MNLTNPIHECRRRIVALKRLYGTGLALLVWLLASGACCYGMQSSLDNPFDLVPQGVENQVDPTAARPESDPLPEVTEGSDAAEEPGSLAPTERQPASIQGQPVANKPEMAVDDAVLKADYRRALVVHFDGPIFGANFSYLKNRLDQARRDRVDLLILCLNSPGGDLEYSLELANRLRDVDWAKTVVYVDREAISGGAIIALGCDRIYLNGSALIGDAGPIRMDRNGQFQHAEEKIVSYLAEAIESLAKSKGRSGAIAQAMVDRTLKVYSATDKQSGETTFITEQQSKLADTLEKWNVGEAIPEAGANRFLTVSGARAVELKLAEGIFRSEEELLAAMRIAKITHTKIRWVDKLVFILNQPWLTGLLLLIGLISLYIELAAPGISVAGATSVACFGIFFWSHALGGTSGWLEVLLFTLGVMAILMELFVVPGTAIFGLSGLLLVLLSLIMATQDFFLPETKPQWAKLQTNTLIVVGTVSAVGVLFMIQLLVLDSLPGLARFQLRAPELEPTTASPVSTSLIEQRVAPELGAVGKAESVLRPSGKAMFEGQLFDVVSDGDYIESQTPVEVVRREGNRIMVRRIG